MNLTQRIQEVAGGGEVVISDSIYHYASGYLDMRKSFEVHLKGLQEKIKLHVPDSKRIHHFSQETADGGH